MARVPEGAELIENPMSGAPGIRIGNIFILAGVPHIAASMLEALTGTLDGGRPVLSVTVGARVAESEVADLLSETEKANPGVAIGSYPFFRDGGLAPISWSGPKTRTLAEICAASLADRLRERGIAPVIGGI